MAAYPQLTPPQRARGLWKIRPPFIINEDHEYTCVAIRTFDDMVNDGLDPYNQIYKPVGLQDGVTVGTTVFNFGEERLRGINIISLMNPIGDIYHVPDNYILSYPSTVAIQYDHFILSASLGPLPTNTDFAMAEQAVVDAVSKYFGITPDVNIHRTDTLTSPTYEQHLEFERVRIAAIQYSDTSANRIAELEAKLAQATQIVNTLTQICIDNNIMPPVTGG